MTTSAVIGGDDSELLALAEALSVAAKRGDWSAVFAFVAEDCELAPFGEDVTYRGREDIIGYFERYLEQGDRWQVERTEIEVAATGALVVAVHLWGREKGDKYGEQLWAHFYYVIELRARKLRKTKGYRYHIDARAAAGLAERSGWSDRMMEGVVTTASEFASRVRHSVWVGWYVAYEAAVISGAAILLAVGWVLLCTAPFSRHGITAYVIVNDVVVIGGGILALVTAVVMRASRWRLFYWLIVVFLFFLLGFAGMYWSIGTQTNFGGLDAKVLSPLDATYFAAGTVSTAGTGNIYAKSQLARGLQLTEMLLGMALILVVVSAIVARLTSGGSRDPATRNEGKADQVHGQPNR